MHSKQILLFQSVNISWSSLKKTGGKLGEMEVVKRLTRLARVLFILHE